MSLLLLLLLSEARRKSEARERELRPFLSSALLPFEKKNHNLFRLSLPFFPPPPESPASRLFLPVSPRSCNARLPAGALGAVSGGATSVFMENGRILESKTIERRAATLLFFAPISHFLRLPPPPYLTLPPILSFNSDPETTQSLDAYLGQDLRPGRRRPATRQSWLFRSPRRLDRRRRRRRDQDGQDRHARLAARARAGVHDARPAQGAFGVGSGEQERQRSSREREDKKANSQRISACVKPSLSLSRPRL